MCNVGCNQAVSNAFSKGDADGAGELSLARSSGNQGLGWFQINVSPCHFNFPFNSMLECRRTSLGWLAQLGTNEETLSVRR
jgi:hypothetical protein